VWRTTESPEPAAISRESSSSLSGYNVCSRSNAAIPIPKENFLADDKLYQAEYLGSGTFVIRKPQRKKNKMRQSKLRNPERGSRK
jgi:hypothetical protein